MHEVKMQLKKDIEQNIGENCMIMGKFCLTLHIIGENMVKIEILFNKSLTFFSLILNLNRCIFLLRKLDFVWT